MSVCLLEFMSEPLVGKDRAVSEDGELRPATVAGLRTWSTVGRANGALQWRAHLPSAPFALAHSMSWFVMVKALRTISSGLLSMRKELQVTFCQLSSPLLKPSWYLVRPSSQFLAR